MLSTLLVTAAFAAAPAPRAPMVFGDARGWVVLSGDGQVVKQMKDICGQQASDVAVSPDLKTVVFTQFNGAVINPLLYACDEGASKPRLLGEATGYHAEPSFSSDGAWVYFGHHPKKGGPPGQHAPGANAQLFRVRLDGTELEGLTDTKGCKLSPRQVGADTVVLIHATCTGPRTIELMRLKDKSVTSTAAPELISHYPDVSPDGRRLVFTQKEYRKVSIVELDLKTKKSRVLREMGPGYEGTHTRYAADGKTIYFQQAGAVWRITAGRKPQTEKVVDFGGAS